MIIFGENFCNNISFFRKLIFIVSPIPEISPSGHESLSAMCQQVTQGLSLLSSNDDFGPTTMIAVTSTVAKQLFTSTTTSTLQGLFYT